MGDCMCGSSVSRVIRGGFWLYASRIANNLGGFVYWLTISKMAGSSILGLTSVTVGLAGLVSGVASLGVGVGLQHFLGRCIGGGDAGCFRRYFWTTTYFSLIVYLGLGGVFLVSGLLGLSFPGFSPGMLFYAGILVILGSAVTVSAALMSMLRTDILCLATITGNVLKIVVGVGLVWVGWGFSGAVLGYMLVSLAMLAVGLSHIVRGYGLSIVFDRGVVGEVLRGSIVSWLPGVIVLAGQWIGVLAVYGSSGALETGHYYVAFILASFVLGIGLSILGLLLPVLSGLSDGRKTAANRVLRISLVIVLPITVYLMVYPWLPLGLLGREYMEASGILAVLLLSSVPVALYAAVNSLAYSYRMYREVLYLGLSQNIPRLILYLLLVPLLGGLGAAYSFTIGSYTGFMYAVYLAYRIGFRVDWAMMSRVVVLPGILGLLVYVFHLGWPIALLVMASSYLLYGRMGVLRRSDLRDIAYAFLGKSRADKLYERLGFLIDFFFS